MNWGKGIIIGLGAFVLFITGMAIYMFSAPVDQYDHQYYEKGLTFNHDYNREEQVVKDHAKPLIQLTADTIKFTFKQPAIGKIKFMRPSDYTLDETFKLNSGTGKQVELSLAGIREGEWQLTLEWESNHKAYLYHKELFIQ